MMRKRKYVFFSIQIPKFLYDFNYLMMISFFSQISQAFSSVLEDITHMSNHKDDEDDYSTDDDDFARNLNNNRQSGKYHMNSNGNYLTSSTPMHSRTHNTNNYRHNDLKSPSRYSKPLSHKNLNNNNDDYDRISPSGHKQKENINTKAAENLLLENDFLSKDFLSLKDKYGTMENNYEALQKQFRDLFGVNEKNLGVIDKLQSKVLSLESRLKQEIHDKEHAIKKADILESSVGSLEKKIQEYHRSDFFSKTAKTHEKNVEALKQKYNHELDLLRETADDLREQLLMKEQEMLAQQQADKNNTNEQMKQVVEITKKKLIKDMQKELKVATNNNRKELITQYEGKLDEIENDWKLKLINDVQLIIVWLNDSVRENEIETKSVPNEAIHFHPIKELCGYLNSYIKEYENRINIKISDYLKMKTILEDILNQSQSCSVSECSEHNVTKEDNARLHQKLKKYEECYQALLKKHQLLLDSLQDDEH